MKPSEDKKKFIVYNPDRSWFMFLDKDIDEMSWEEQQEIYASLKDHKKKEKNIKRMNSGCLGIMIYTMAFSSLLGVIGTFYLWLN